MLKIAKYDEIIRNKKSAKEILSKAEYQTFQAYEDSKSSGNELINFGDVIWDNEIKPIVATLKKLKISEFTIHSTATGFLTNLAIFQENGAFVKALVEVKGTGWDFFNPDEHNKIPAILMEIR